MTNHAYARSASRGFTLIEVLIAIVVVSLGLLGVLALQVGTLHASHDAYLTSIANIQAMDLEERIRANRGAIADYLEDFKNVASRAVSDNCENNACNPAELAQYDVTNWVSSTRGFFPGDPSITLANPNGNTYQLTLTWTEPVRNSGENPNRTFNYLFVLDST